ncbi:hypothetical protein HNQ43_000008 [Faecalicoccus acidiformans]|nr:hypothetical protein [Faecalicoccus acidiformans]
MDRKELIMKLKQMKLPVIAERYEMQSSDPDYS